MYNTKYSFGYKQLNLKEINKVIWAVLFNTFI